MRDIDLFEMALGLRSPWYVDHSAFCVNEQRLDIYLDFERGGKFSCPECDLSDCSAYDSSQKAWRHLNFFEHETYLHARLPRISCPDCGIKTVGVPWSRPESGFTLLFEAYILTLAKQMPINAIAALVKEHDTRLWRILHHYVEDARARADYSKIHEIGVDETASKRGHNYITTFVDMAASKVIFATPGKDSATVTAFLEDLKAHGGKPEHIREACCDMSPAFISGLKKTFCNACITFDRFHIMKIINQDVDQVRREEQKECPELKNSRYVWLKNPDHLTLKQQTVLEHLNLKGQNLKTARAYQMKLTFQDLYNQPPSLAETFLKKWYFWATHSRLQPMIDAAHTIKNHWHGVLRWFHSGLSNGVLEGINSLIQAAKARARGFRSTKNLITLVYLIAGKLNLRLPT